MFIQSWYSDSSQAAFPCLYSRGIRTAPKLLSRVYTVVVFGQLPSCFPVFIQSWYSDSSQAASPCLYSRGIRTAPRLLPRVYTVVVFRSRTAVPDLCPRVVTVYSSVETHYRHGCENVFVCECDFILSITFINSFRQQNITQN